MNGEAKMRKRKRKKGGCEVKWERKREEGKERTLKTGWHPPFSDSGNASMRVSEGALTDATA